MSKIKENLDKIEQKVDFCCQKASRNRKDVNLVVVTKTATVEQIKEVYELGYRNFGENRLPHLKEVSTAMADFAPENDPIVWDMIGHMQRNKVKQFLPLVSRIHSIDSLRIISEIVKVADSLGRGFDCFLQVNCSGEQQKYGIEPRQAADLADEITTNFPQICLVGLMTMAPFTLDTHEITKTFRLAAKLFDDIKTSACCGNHFSRLSMGMTNDYEIAIAEGATDIRIGSAVFE